MAAMADDRILVWPFRRKNRPDKASRARKRRAGEGRSWESLENARRQKTTGAAAPGGGDLTRRPGQKLSKAAVEKPGLTPSSQDRLATHDLAPEGRGSAPHLPRLQHELEQMPTGLREEIPPCYLLDPTSTASLGSHRRHSPPRLHVKRGANDSGLLRRRSSKKKKHDHAREQEIRSMSAAAPTLKRPVTQSGAPDVSRRRFDSSRASEKPAASGVPEGELSRPTSGISALDPRFMQSSIFGSSEQLAFNVKSLDVLSPWPTIRYSDPTRHGTPSWGSAPSRSNSRREKQAPIPEDVINSKKRVDELADSLDSGGIRQLMERDQRRKERRRASDERRMQRKLERQAERQRLAESKAGEAAAGDRDVRKDPFEAIDDGTHFEEITAAVDAQQSNPDSRRGDANQSPLSWLQDPSTDRLPEDPFGDADAAATAPTTEQPTPAEEHEEPVIETAQAVRLSQASMSTPAPATLPPRPTSGVSQVTDSFRENTASTYEPTVSDNRGSGSSFRGNHAGTWMSFFRRSAARSKHESADRAMRTSSELSNASRDSLPRQYRPSSVRNSAQRKSGVPKRTTSKFREDLPELPLSPPDSRLQSPEAAAANPAGPPQTGSTSESTTTRQKVTVAAVENPKDVPVQKHVSMDAPSIDEMGPRTLVSHSLGSIDSEGSWLSGRPSKRTSQTHPYSLRHSASSLNRRFQDFSDSEELGVAEDEYFSRLTPALELDDQLGERQKPSSVTIASSESDGDGDGGEDDGVSKEQRTWHGGVARHPTVVHHTARARSKEGLLNEYQTADERGLAPPDSPESDGRSFEYPSGEGDSTAQPTTTTVGMGAQRHIRHISAGSARLLEIAPRSSSDKRMSSGSGHSLSRLRSDEM